MTSVSSTILAEVIEIDVKVQVVVEQIGGAADPFMALNFFQVHAGLVSRSALQIKRWSDV